MAKLFKVGAETSTTFNPSNGEAFTLEELQKAVGGYVQFAPQTIPGVIIVCDEEGRMKGKEINKLASFVSNQLLVGDVLFCDEDEIE